MKYLFINYYVVLFLKGKHKELQVFIAALFIILPFLRIGYLVNFFIGRPIHLPDLLALLFTIYFILNFIYSIYNKGITTDKAPTVRVSSIKTSPAADFGIKQNDEIIILNPKHYAGSQPLKSSPRRNTVLPQKENKTISPSTPNNPTANKPKEKETAPPLEVNFESAEEFMQEELTHEYSGVANEILVEQPQENKTDVTIITGSALPDPETLFNKIQGKDWV